MGMNVHRVAMATVALVLFTTVQSGTPMTTVVDILGIDTVPLYGRGDLGRS